MSVIFVFVGQCGNQVGAAICKKLAANCSTDATTSTSSASNRSGKNSQQSHVAGQPGLVGPFFTSDGHLRAVLVDCEPKVVDSVVQTCRPLIRPTNLVTGRSGRGNSWSLGYCGLPETDEAEVQAGAFRVSCAKDQLERDRTVLCRALKALHAETRRCEDGMVESIVVVHSLAGGTGSGLGCALVENIRYHFCSNGAVHDQEEGEDGDDFQQQQHVAGDTAGAHHQDIWASHKPAQAFRKAQSKRDEERRRPPSILSEEMIREGCYGEPRKARFVCSVCVSPLVQGELAVQSINACLTLRTLIKNCDAVILLRNDCQKLFKGFEHQHAPSAASARGGSSSSSSSSFAQINDFFASLLVAAFQGGRTFGCITELLEASVFRVAGVDWSEISSSQSARSAGGGDANVVRVSTMPQKSFLSYDDVEDDDQDHRHGNNTNITCPKPGPRLLTLVPWDPRSPWAAGFRRSSVTATLCGDDNSRGNTNEMLRAYLCNEITNSMSCTALLCSILNRSTTAGETRDDRALGVVSAPTSGKGGASSSSSPVLVLNQCTELCSSILMPFFRDVSAKVDSGAYMHAFNVRGILSQVFQPQPHQQRVGNISSNKRSAPSTFGTGRGGDNQQPRKKFSPRRSHASEKANTEFARKFVNAAVVELLEYMCDSFPGV